MEFTMQEREAVKKFFAVLAERCKCIPDRQSCPQCDMRLFCFMPTQSKTAGLIDKTMDFLESFAPPEG